MRHDGGTTADGVLPGADEVRAAVAAAMPTVVSDLEALVRIPSIAFPGFPEEPVLAAAALVGQQLAAAGFGDVRQLPVPGAPPAVYAEIPAPPGAPTVLLYAHYDVQPAPDESLWHTPPFEPTVRDGRLYGRGAADDKSGIAVHCAAVRAFAGRPPVGVKVVVEGSEECGGSALEHVVREHSALLGADVVIVADAGNWRLGEPTITSTLRGMAALVVEVRTLEGAVHSGMFGGPAPDAMTAMVRVLATLHDEAGEVAVPGLGRIVWDGIDYPEADFRRAAGVLPGVDLVGTGTVAERLFAKPTITITGIDAPGVAVAPNAVLPVVRAKLSVRVPPGGDPVAAQDAVQAHLESVRPWNVALTVTPTEAGMGFAAVTSGSAYSAAERAMQQAYGMPAVRIGSGGSIPLVPALAETYPNAEILIWGAQDDAAQIHAPNEGVDLDELRKASLAEALLFVELAGSPRSVA